MPGENENQIKDFQAMQKLVFDAVDRAKRCCFNCANFQEANLFCLTHKGNPPPRVVCFGCDRYIPSDEVPY